HFYKEQITNYDWVDENFIKNCVNLMLKTLPDKGDYESDCNFNNISGSIDYLTNDNIWEFKCANSISDEHLIQTAIYICLYYYKYDKILPGKLYNVRTGQIFLLTVKNIDDFYKI